MKTQRLSYQETGRFSKLVLDYINQKESVKDFISEFPTIKNFRKQIDKKSNDFIDRELLFEVLEEQNTKIELSKSSQANLNLLKDNNTYTVTTGHQLCIFTGPLYFIYKIISTINLVNSLKSKYPSYNFVPVFWLASEDHDFDEISSINLFNKKVSWKTNQKGSVGRMKLDDFDLVLDELDDLMCNDKNYQHLREIFRNSYNKQNNLSEATRVLINQLFGSYGLLVIDGDDKKLKRKLIDVIDKDINENHFYKIISKTNKKIQKLYHKQAFVRPVNFFDISNNNRVRIENKIDKQKISDSPENYSPNVLLRPIYQEMILPNIAYVGGGGEISYWLQLRDVFSELSLSMPIIVLRNSVLFIDEKQSKKITDLGLNSFDFFSETDEIISHYIKNTSDNIDISSQISSINDSFFSISKNIKDQGLIASLNALNQKTNNSLNDLEKKIIKNLKNNKADKINHINKLKALLFPENNLQERYDSFVMAYSKFGDNFIKNLISSLDPLDTNFVILDL